MTTVVGATGMEETAAATGETAAAMAVAATEGCVGSVELDPRR
jgi:hypothetical protein